MASKAATPRPSKYGNVLTTLEGRTFASKAEARRYQELGYLRQAGLIRDLVCHPRYPLRIDGALICTYVGDFAYTDVATGASITEDVKSEATAKIPIYRLKKKLLLALLGITIVEVTA